jgi:hypothetical protein
MHELFSGRETLPRNLPRLLIHLLGIETKLGGEFPWRAPASCWPMILRKC